MRVLSTLGMALAIPFALCAQNPGLTSPAPVPSQADIFVPIHGGFSDLGVPYGTWAAGPEYKVSFHDGYAFYPVLGKDYPHNLPLRWTTTRVRVGERDVFPAGTAAQHAQVGEWRYEYRFPGVTEAYEVRRDGVEQFFVLPNKPEGQGDLIVTGAIQTELVCQPAGFEHQVLTFRDQSGKAILEYRSAIAFDATGLRTEVETSFDGTSIQLRVPAAWLATATYPVTIDPLTAPVVIATGASASATLDQPEIGRDDLAATYTILYAYGRISSASDYDTFVRITRNDYSGTTIVYSDVTASWSNRNHQVAFVGAPKRWIVVFQREFPTSTTRGRGVLLNSNSTTLVPAGSYFTFPWASGTAQTFPDAGGTRSTSTSGNNALVVFQQDVVAAPPTPPNTNTSDCIGILANVSGTGISPTWGTAFPLAGFPSGTSKDRDYPSVSQVSNGGTDHWGVAWQEYNNPISGDDWDITVNMVSSTGTVKTPVYLANQASTADHAITPRVEGQIGRFMITYSVLDNTGTKSTATAGKAIEGQRFDWSIAGAAPSITTIRTVAGPSASTSYITGNIAYDTDTDSHWAITYQATRIISILPPVIRSSVFVERVGYRGLTTEAQTLFSDASLNGFAPSVCYDSDLDEFKCVYGTNDASLTLYARSLTYDATAINVSYGSACSTAVLGSASKPVRGHEFYGLTVTGMPAGAPLALLLGSNPAALNLNSIGMNGCTLNLAPILVTVNATATAAGSFRASFAIPETIVPGNVYWQVAHLDLAAPWPTKVRMTNGLRTQIR
ncbi:MAG: hypothetical protein IT458_18930 [Planctomycetes bacterium]|nr:hypothetical protein [Planctomycetota bacterium]